MYVYNLCYALQLLEVLIYDITQLRAPNNYALLISSISHVLHCYSVYFFSTLNTPNWHSFCQETLGR